LCGRFAAAAVAVAGSAPATANAAIPSPAASFFFILWSPPRTVGSSRFSTDLEEANTNQPIYAQETPNMLDNQPGLPFHLVHSCGNAANRITSQRSPCHTLWARIVPS